MAAEASVVETSSHSQNNASWNTHNIKDNETIIAVVKDGTSTDGGYRILSLDESDDINPFKLQITPTSNLPAEFLDRWLLTSLPAHLQDGQLYILVSTKSGSGRAVEFSSVLQNVLEAIGLPASHETIVQTQNEDSVRDFVTSTLLPSANYGRKQTVILLSGDGGVVDTINAIEQAGTRSGTYQSPVIALFPLGTGNALFHSIHKSSTIPSFVQGLGSLLRGQPKSLPVFQANFSPGARLLTNEGRTATPLTADSLFGAVVASYGLHATLVADSDTTEWRKHGDKRFGMVAQSLLSPEEGGPPHAYQADVTLNNSEPIPRDNHGYVLLTLVSNLEKTFTVSPLSTPLEGKLRLIHFGPLDGKEVMSIMGSAYDGGKHIERPEVGYVEVDKLKITFNEKGEDSKWRRCCIDGSIVAVEEGGWMDVKLAEGEILRVLT